MVSLKEIRAANGAISSKSLTAVFVGATSGIGLGGIEALLKSTTSSKVYIVGRSLSKFASALTRLETLDETAKIIFIEAQVSLLKEVDRVCRVISTQETTIDVLWLSQGGLSLAEHQLTSEGIFDAYATKYYSRMLFMHELMPLLQRSTDGRVISILATGMEGPVDLSDPGYQNSGNYSFLKSQKQGVTMMSLAMRELSSKNLDIAFIHTNPGMVSTAVHEKWAQTMTGILTPLQWLTRWVLIPIMHFFGFTPEEAGQTGLYEITDDRFSCRSGKNFFRLWDNAEEETTRGQAILTKYENDGTQSKLWEHTEEVFEQVLGK